MPHRVFFDDSLPCLLQYLISAFGIDAVERGTILRDASGRLSFFAADNLSSRAEEDRSAKELEDSLGPYGRTGRSLVFPDDGERSPLLSSSERIPLKIDNRFCYLVDRRIVGSGWLAAPLEAVLKPPRIVFATLKGGVGRSTALAVTAADLARRNKNVLVVDLDLEAPGLGNLMLDDDRTPEFGVIDYLVENGIQGIREKLLLSFLGTSGLTNAGGGRVDVMPALGKSSLHSPHNVLAKLSRAMVEDVSEGAIISVGEQISAMIDRMVRMSNYDVVLVDSRAGMAELAAPAVIGIGATVLLFGTAQKQTIEGYRSLFAALQLLAQRDRSLGRAAEWRTSLRPVYAKAGLDPKVEELFLDDMYELFSTHLYDEEDGRVDDTDGLRFTRDDRTAPHWPLHIPFSQTFIDFDPTRTPGQLAENFYDSTYGAFLKEVDRIIAANDGSLQQ